MSSGAATLPATSLGRYLASVDRIWQSWNAARPGMLADIWFRGHPDSTWPLQPGARRSPFDQFSEHRLRHDFQLKSQPYLAELVSRPKDDWEWYFLMQHYGLPTRLLDWTESALVALYFALIPGPTSQEKSPACVWVLNPRAVNSKLSQIGDFVPIYSDASLSRYVPPLWNERVALPASPAAFDPPANSPRIAAQRGKFTVHGRSRKPLESYRALGESLQRIEIPAKYKVRLRRQFLLAGVSEAMLFPSLSSVASEITKLYAREW